MSPNPCQRRSSLRRTQGRHSGPLSSDSAGRRATCQIGVFCSAAPLCSICSISYLVGGTSGPETVPLSLSGGGTWMFRNVSFCFILSISKSLLQRRRDRPWGQPLGTIIVHKFWCCQVVVRQSHHEWRLKGLFLFGFAESHPPALQVLWGVSQTPARGEAPPSAGSRE